MNSGALVKIETRDSWMEQALGARGARLLLVAGGTIALTLSIPTSLLEDITTATGLSEMAKYFAPPIGLGSRLLLGSILALVPAGIVWALWGSPAPVEPQPAYEAELLEIEDEDEMMHARKQVASATARPGLAGTLLRLVRGGFHDNPDAQAGTLSRRRRDRHPDAPPRPPLSASRDLPPHDEQLVAEDEVAAFAPEAEAPPFVAGLVDAAAIAAPAPIAAPVPDILIPRAPEPLSEEEIARVVATIPPRAAPVRPSYAKDSSADLLRSLDLPLIANTNLADLAARFERGVAKREVVALAQDAQAVLDKSIAFAQPDLSVRAALRAHRPVELVMPSAATHAIADFASEESPMRVDADVEHALNSALATLRKLTEQGRR